MMMLMLMLMLLMMMMMMMMMVLSHILQFWRIWRIPLRSHSRFMLPKKYRAKWFKNTGSSWSENIYRFTDLFRNILYHQNPMMSSESECFRTWVITGWVFPHQHGDVFKWIYCIARRYTWMLWLWGSVPPSPLCTATTDWSSTNWSSIILGCC